jgi:hypothetical protein
MSTVRAGPGDSGDRDWPGDVELDLLLLTAHASGLSALAGVIDTEQGLAAILAHQQEKHQPGPQRPEADQLPRPAASRSPPPLPQPGKRDPNQPANRKRSTR